MYCGDEFEGSKDVFSELAADGEDGLGVWELR